MSFLFKKTFLLSGFSLLLISGCTGVNYNILTGKENLTFISEEREVKLGKKISKQVEEEYEIIQDPRVKDIVKKVGYKIVDSCDRKGVVYYFEAIKRKRDEDREEPNAFALPGGYIYINDKLLDLIGWENEDEIAAVLAHEISHIVLRHNILKLQEVIGTQALLIMVGTSTPDARTAKNSQVAMILLLLAYSKEREFEADRLALKYLQKADFNPQGMISLLKKIQKFQFDSPIKRYYLKTHPYLDERIEQVQKELKIYNNILY
ncbi:MAG: M48 family metalloprotease [Candidatus Kaelpia imicola]|nr:M48 family metalloprotease [Candidatus Kaelpia imicola]